MSKSKVTKISDTTDPLVAACLLSKEWLEDAGFPEGTESEEIQIDSAKDDPTVPEGMWVSLRMRVFKADIASAIERDKLR